MIKLITNITMFQLNGHFGLEIGDQQIPLAEATGLQLLKAKLVVLKQERDQLDQAESTSQFHE
jgi:hypothetical protein